MEMETDLLKIPKPKTKIDWSSLILNIAIGAASIFLITLCAVVFIKFSEPFTINLNGRTITEPQPYAGELMDFVVVAHRFSEQHNYDRNGYNCVNYTTDLKRITDALGFETEIINGCPPNGTCHRWLRLSVDFEPQQAQFVDYSKDYPKQRVVS